MKQETVNALLDFKSQIKTIYASSSKDKKKLFILGNGNYLVEHNGREIWRGMGPLNAIEKYNELGGHQL